MVDPSILKNLVPLHNLAEGNLRRLAKRLSLEELPKGYVVFREGDTDNHSIYLLEGGVELLSHGSTLSRVVQGGTEEATYPVAQARRREFTATTTTAAKIIRIDTRKLDRVIVLDELTTTITTIQGGKKKRPADTDTEWLEEMFVNPAFSKLSTETVVAVVLKMERVVVTSGQVVFKQGDAGEYYYVVRDGQFTVSRKEPLGKVKILNQLKRGSVFGEESLISGESRDASIVAMSDGTLMRLSKKDFSDVLQKPLVAFVSSIEARRRIKDGATLMDVRTQEEFQRTALRDSVNVPIAELRDRIDGLDRSLKYVVCCRSGVQSEIAAFLLSQRGFDACVLKGGLQAVANKESSA